MMLRGRRSNREKPSSRNITIIIITTIITIGDTTTIITIGHTTIIIITTITIGDTTTIITITIGGGASADFDRLRSLAGGQMRAVACLPQAAACGGHVSHCLRDDASAG
jgi:hypothetical protein